MKEGHEYTIYLKGHLSSFIEYGGEVYPLWESEEEQPLIVTATEKNDQLIIKNVTEYQLGDAGSEAIFEAFPKHLAMQMLSGTKGREDTIDIIKERSLLNAASHFGKPIAEEKELEIDIRTGEISVHLTIEEEQ